MDRRHVAIFAGLALVLVGLTYANSYNSPFHFDDAHSVRDNAWVKSLGNIDKFLTDVKVFSPLAENRSYRPALLTSYAVSHTIGGGAMWGYHLGNVMVHAMAALFLGLLLMRLLPAEGLDDRHVRGAALVGAAIFCVHPLLSEPVNYISARSSSMAAALMLGAVYFYVAGRQDGRRKALWLSSLFLLLAMATKIIAMTAPALMLGWELLCRGRERPERRQDVLRALAGPALVALGFTVLHELMLSAGVRGARSQITPISYLLTETQVWLRYIGLFFWPQDLSADLTMPWATSAVAGPVARAILLNGALIVAALSVYKTRPVVTLGVLWYFIALSPTNSIVPLSEPATEHRVYIAIPGVVMVVTALGARWARRSWARRWQRVVLSTLIAGMLLALGLRTHERNKVWQSERTLWKSVIDVSPDNGRAHLNYGLALMAARDYAGAKASFDRCAKEWPGYSFCYINQAVLALHLNRRLEAERAIAIAERLKPRNVYVLRWRGEVELKAERFAAAEVAFAQSLEVAPGYANAELGLALARFEQGKLAEAAPVLEALERRGALDARGWFARGLIADRAGDTEAAKGAYQRALRGDPKDRRARYNLGVIAHREGDLEAARAAYDILAREPDVAPEVLDNLVRVHWKSGRLDEARKVRQRLRAMAPQYTGLEDLKSL